MDPRKEIQKAPMRDRNRGEARRRNNNTHLQKWLNIPEGKSRAVPSMDRNNEGDHALPDECV